MESTDGEINSVLTAALTGYLKILDLEHHLSESSQPRRGKNIESSIDVLRRQYYQSRTLTTQACISFAPRIAKAIRSWMCETNDIKIITESFETKYPALPENLIEVRPSDEKPYVDSVSGFLVESEASCSAGPSLTRNLLWEEKLPGIKTSPSAILPMSNVGSLGKLPGMASVQCTVRLTEPEITSIPSEMPTLPEKSRRRGLFSTIEVLKGNDKVVPGIPGPVSDYQLTVTSMVDPVEIQNAVSSPEICISRRESSDGGKALSTRTRGALCLDSKIKDPNHLKVTSDGGEATTSRISAERACTDRVPIDEHKFESDLGTVTSVSAIASTKDEKLDVQRGGAQLQITPDSVSRGNRHKPGDSFSTLRPRLYQINSGRVARAKQNHSQRLKATETPSPQSNIQQRPIQDLLIREVPITETLVDISPQPNRTGEDKLATEFKHDIEAILSRWEREAHELREQNKRLAQEIEHAEESERQRLAIVTATAKRRSEGLRRKAQAKQQKEEAERRALLADCASCMESTEKTEMCILSCDHAYCGGCIQEAFHSASKSRTLFKCCRVTVSASVAHRWLGQPFIRTYQLMALEITTLNPRYCSGIKCRRFIPPQDIHGPIATCSSCSTRTCTACGLAEHAGICKEDKDGLVVQSLATRMGWKSCPSCSAIIQKSEGCLHMTCRCRAQWCWSCLRDWDSCKSTCPRR